MTSTEGAAARRPNDPDGAGTTVPQRSPRRLRPSRVLAGFVAWTTLCWGIVGILLAPVVPGGAIAVVVAALLSALPLFALARLFGGGRYPGAAMRLWVLRPFWYLQLLLPLLSLSGAVGGLLGWPFGAAGAAGRTGLVIGAALFTLAAIAGYLGSRRLVVRRLTATVAGLPAGLHGLRIVQLSDLHVGPHTSRQHLSRVVAEVRHVRPDLIVFTGDQVDDHAGDTAHFGAAFAGLRAPLGVFAIPGNHDVYAGWSAVREGLERIGIRVLTNEAVEVKHNEERLWIVGTGDPAGMYWPGGGGNSAAPDLDRALAEVRPGAFLLALAHNPALWPELAVRGVPLTLSGHTHYGQLALPWLEWSLASLFLDHAMGVHRNGQSLLYIHPGTNYWGIPFRLGTPSEVAVITLAAGISLSIQAE